ncbi:carboxymuconolactone decarboxylase family protein [Actinomadura roseirufa]|uniref:carboxymuconolactone decarboxylase family protein n=1 Tax=Actinomadura roseirufa TaxID=2094049 RepID=UPI001F5F5CE4|nr:carboxymuconolactone decarboxylase family protein [Actinomadura roseirufa]
MSNPAVAVPGALPALTGLGEAVQKAGLPPSTLNLVYLRASQINGSGWNVRKHAADLREAGESAERVDGVAAWREAPFYSGAERAALALAEAATRIGDRTDPVPDEVWHEAAVHYSEPELAALLLAIGLGNLWHRLIIATRQPAA